MDLIDLYLNGRNPIKEVGQCNKVLSEAPLRLVSLQMPLLFNPTSTTDLRLRWAKEGNAILLRVCCHMAHDQFRSQLLGDLEERFNSLEEGSRNMVAQVSLFPTWSSTLLNYKFCTG